jgi:aminopeptidase
VAEELLDRPEIGAALEQMRCERVPQAVRVGEHAPERRRVEAAAAHGEEERVLGAAGQRRTRVAEIPGEPPRSLFTQGHHPLLASLAADVDVLLFEVDVLQIERDRFRAPQSARVHELDERAVAQRERAVAVERVERRVDLVRARRIGQPARETRRERCIRDSVGPEREAEERPHRGETARDRRGREPPPAAAEARRVVGELTHADVLEAQLPFLQPRREVREIEGVGAARGVGKTRAREKPVDLATELHGDAFAPRLRSPAVEERIQRLAELTVRFGANVQPGQVVAVAAETGHEAIARAVADQAYAAGAKFVDVYYYDPYVKRSRLRHVRDEDLDYVPPWFGERQLRLGELRGCRISLAGSTAPRLFDDVDPVRAGRDQFPALKESLAVTNARSTNWTIVPAPNIGWASSVHPDLEPAEALERLWEDVAHVLRLDEPDPVAAWEERIATLNASAKRLNDRGLEALHFEGPGTDLTIGLLPTSSWLAADFETIDGVRHMPNLPTEEVFTTPDPERTEGVVASTKPLLLPSGATIEGLRVRFEGGRAVDVDAEVGADVARGLVGRDDGAARLGEVALVDKEGRIGKLGTAFRTTLIDENSASHIALGNGYSFVIGAEDVPRMNTSAIHVDFMIGSDDVSVTGVTRDGEQTRVLAGGSWQL